MNNLFNFKLLICLALININTTAHAENNKNPKLDVVDIKNERLITLTDLLSKDSNRFHFAEIAKSIGFVEMKKIATLQNNKQLKVKCQVYSLGFFDEIKLENKFQHCIKNYKQAGYKVISKHSN